MYGVGTILGEIGTLCTKKEHHCAKNTLMGKIGTLMRNLGMLMNAK